MTDSRPRPEYGEYATPEQQAAAMGRAYVPPPDPATRVVAEVPVPGEAPQPNPFVLSGSLIDRFVTVFQLGVGLVLLISSDFFHFAENSNSFAEEAGISQRVSVGIDHYGWLLLGANIVLLLATFVWAYSTLRRGRLAFYIPFLGFVVFLGVVALTVAIVR